MLITIINFTLIQKLFLRIYRFLFLPHYYGTLHPQTKEIIKYCKDKNIKLINDAAQSYKLIFEGRDIIKAGDGGFYSFGPGKSSTVCGGAILSCKHLPELKPNTYFYDYFLGIFARAFLVNRTLRLSNARTKLIEKIMFLAQKYILNKKVTYMHKLQFYGFLEFQKLEKKIRSRRKENWNILYKNLNNCIYKIPKFFLNSHCYKYVFYLEKEKKLVDDFKIAMKRKEFL